MKALIRIIAIVVVMGVTWLTHLLAIWLVADVTLADVLELIEPLPFLDLSILALVTAVLRVWIFPSPAAIKGWQKFNEEVREL